jgi:hypothetical protein
VTFSADDLDESNARQIEKTSAWLSQFDLSGVGSDLRPDECCGVCPGIVGGGYDCTCTGNPRCPKFSGAR